MIRVIAFRSTVNYVHKWSVLNTETNFSKVSSFHINIQRKISTAVTDGALY